MKSIKIVPSVIRGSICLPPSKSQTMRAIIFASLAKGKSIIYNYLISTDVDKMIEACRSFGAFIEKDRDKFIVEGVGGEINFRNKKIDAGNSGIIFRFLTAIAALNKDEVTIDGDKSIRENRVIKPLLKALKMMGAEVNKTSPPFTIKGPINSFYAHINAEDSQLVSALVILSSILEKEVCISIENAKEIPWINVTLAWLDLLNINYENDRMKKIIVKGKKGFDGFIYKVPCDYSSLAFPVVSALKEGSSITIDNIDLSDSQGDKQFIFLLKQMGANISFEKNKINVVGGAILHGIDVDIDDMIDAISILAVVGTITKGSMRIYNGHIARKKESDRVYSIVREIKKMKGLIEEKNDGFIVKKSSLNGSKDLFSHRDHRLALSLSIASIFANGESIVNDVSCIDKSYPNFVSDMQSINMNIRFL